MFHFAPPEVNGLGSSTSTSPVTRSSQPWMFSGLPLRTMNTTTESVTKPSCSFWFQLLVDQARVHEPGHVRLERELDHVGGQPALDRARLLARRRVGLVEAHRLALWRLVEGGDQLLVCLLGGGVGHEREVAAAAAIAARIIRLPAAAGEHRKGQQQEQRCESWIRSFFT